MGTERNPSCLAAQQVARLGFTKYGHDGAWIKSRRGSGDFEFLAPGTAETPENRMCGWAKANGACSPVRGG